MNVNKPITMMIEETKMNLVKVCNESGLSPAVLDLIMSGIYSEIRSMAERQSAEEKSAYMKMITENASTDNEEKSSGNGKKKA